MFSGILRFILVVLTLLGAGFLSYTYFEQTIGSRDNVPVAEVLPISVAPKTAIKAPVKVPAKVTTKTSGLVPSATSTEKTVVTPGPLRVALPIATTPSSDLTVRGVLEYTNGARSLNGGLPALIGNEALDRNAQIKLDDMFAKQYFEHISPSDVGPGDLAKIVGYAYVIVGENLALGDFGSDEKLVTAWMNSPGHRANILNRYYQEIGVAVGKGMYEGRETWLAVQSFGMPLSACPSIDAVIKMQIDNNNMQVVSLRAQLDAKKAQIDSTSANDSNYNIYVAEFNVLVPEYNNLVELNKALILTYNAQVQAYNNCINSVTPHASTSALLRTPAVFSRHTPCMSPKNHCPRLAYVAREWLLSIAGTN